MNTMITLELTATILIIVMMVVAMLIDSIPVKDTSTKMNHYYIRNSRHYLYGSGDYTCYDDGRIMFSADSGEYRLVSEYAPTI